MELDSTIRGAMSLGCGSSYNLQHNNRNQSKVEQAYMKIQGPRPQRLSHEVNCVSQLLGRMSEDRYKLIHFKYWASPNITMDDIANHLDVSRQTCRNRLDEVLTELQKKLNRG